MKLIEKDLHDAKIKAEEASRTKTTFLSHMSHEIRTPLNAIIGYSELIYDTESDMDKRYKLRAVVKSGKHLKQIIDSILDIAKIEAGDKKPNNAEFSLPDVIENAYRIVQANAKVKGLKFDLIKRSILPNFVIGDSLKIKQILINILSNAVNYTEKGSITFEVCYKDGQGKFTVSDTGVGMKEEQIPTIFEPFEQVTNSRRNVSTGTGLGLAIVKQLIEAMDGSIVATSTLGVGSKFETIVPLPKVVKEKQEKVVKKKVAYDFSYLKILIAEDNLINQKLMKAIMKRAGVDCVIAGNGQIALDKLRESEFDLLLLDIEMPVMNGLEAIKHIREDENLKTLPVIALTAFAMEESKQKYLAAGCDDFAAKPVNKIELYEKIALLCPKK